MYKYNVIREVDASADALKKCETPAEAKTLIERLQEISNGNEAYFVEVARYDMSGKSVIEKLTGADWIEFGAKRYEDILDAIS